MEKLKNIDFPTVVFVLIGLRACLVDFTIGQALAMVAVCAYLGVTKYLAAQQQPDINAETKEQIDSMQKTIDETRTNMSGIMIKNAMKPEKMQQELNRRMF